MEVTLNHFRERDIATVRLSTLTKMARLTVGQLEQALEWIHRYPDLLLATRGGQYKAPAIDAGPEDPLLCWPPAMRLAEIVQGRV